MHLGYVKLYRNLINNEIFQNEKLLKVFIWCILKANYKERSQIVGRNHIKLKEGQFVFGRNKAALELSMAPSTLWDYMQLLKNINVIDIESNNKYSIVSVEKWTFYQTKDNICDSESDSNIDNKSTSNKQQINTNKKEYKVKNDKNKEIHSRVITRLNQMSNKNYKSDTKKTTDCIDERLKEGFTEEDFYKVISNKCSEWLNNKNMNKYLRPETLFGNKFQIYLNQEINTYNSPNQPVNYITRTSYVEDDLEIKRKEYGLL